MRFTVAGSARAMRSPAVAGTRQRVSLRKAAFLVLVATLAACGQAADKPAEPPANAFVPVAQAMDFYRTCLASKVRLDAPAAPDNSYLQEFAPGVVLHVPKCLEPNLDFAKLKQPAKAAAVSMTFWYPDMTMSDSPVGTVETIFQKERNEYVQQKDRFREHLNKSTNHAVAR